MASTSPQANGESHSTLREQLYVERLEIGREQYRRAQRLDEIRALLRGLEEPALDG